MGRHARRARRFLGPPVFAATAAAGLLASYAATTGPAAAAPEQASAAYATLHTSRDLATVPKAAAAATALALTTARGETLTAIARQFCGTVRFWPEIWWANRRRLHNPNVLPARITITVPPCRATRPAVAAAALAAIPPPPPPPAASPVTVQAPAPGQGQGQYQPAAAAVPAPAAAPPAATGSVAPSSAYEACVIAHESGGNAGAVNPSSGAGGLYQFLPSTWAALGRSGLPQNASPAEQQAAFNQLYAQQGSAPWSSDGC